MNGALFRTRCEAIGYGMNEVARILKVDSRTVRRWMSGAAPVPPFAAEWIDDGWREFLRTVNRIVRTARQHAERYGDELVSLGRYRTEEAAREAGVSRHFYGRAIDAAVIVLAAEGYSVDVRFVEDRAV